MARPHIIRADTIDLQDPISPSAQDHTKQPTHPSATGTGRPAPHQAETLREVAAEELEEQHRTPRLSDDWSNGDDGAVQRQFSDDMSGASLTDSNLKQQDALTVAQNGGHTGTTAEDAEMADAEGDDGLDDDDMMDKISSSPSIDDGGYSLPLLWPERLDSLSPASSPKTSPLFPQIGDVSSSPYVEAPMHYPAQLQSQQIDVGASHSDVNSYFLHFDNHRSTGSSLGDVSSEEGCELRDALTPPPDDMRDEHIESYDDDFEGSGIDDLLEVQVEFDLDQSFDSSVYDEATMTIPYESSEEDEDDDFPFPVDSRFIDSGWGGECLQETEDIDFDFVYALHTFVATVEGQANATKGDTMVLLDDSNSYWWLVRVVKDASIGYLPAEHIETPTERLARLNKHRNIDLSATMLGDNTEKIKNPLKKVIRRRTTKTVTFSAPTYVEASDVDYSSDEEEGDIALFAQDANQGESKSKAEEDETSAEPKTEKDLTRDVAGPDDVVRGSNDTIVKSSSDSSRTGDEIMETKPEGTRQSRNGTVRNTDSFFKDDSVETRKITITPNLLRDDSSVSTRTSNDSKDIRQRSSLDKSDKEPAPEKSKDEKKKRDKKEKDKKPGMLSGLFKRKDKKLRNVQDEDIDEFLSGKKPSIDEARSSPAPSKDSEEFAVSEEPRSSLNSPQKQHSRLQKQPRGDGLAPKVAPVMVESNIVDAQQILAPNRPPPALTAIESPMRLAMSADQQSSTASQQSRVRTPDVARSQYAGASSQEDQKSDDTLVNASRTRSGSNSDSKTEKLKKATEELEQDDSDASVDVSPTSKHVKQFDSHDTQKITPAAITNGKFSTPTADITNAVERLSESPVQISTEDLTHSNPPALMVDSSSQEEIPSPVSSPSPELVDVDEIRGKKGSEVGSSTPTSTSTWNDAHLRTFFDDDSDIRDLLIVVYDKSGVVPAGPDHPITGNLFKEENAKLADITNRLDGMLGDWLARRAKSEAS